MLKQIFAIYRKELYSCFNTGLAYFVLGIYAVLSMLGTFYMGNFLGVNNSSLFSFFYFQNDMLIILIPALTMRLWSEERKYGTIEFLLTQPVPLFSAVFAKFAAAWSMCVVMFSVSLPFWLYMNHYYRLDNVNIAASYFACFMVAGCFSAVGCMISSFCTGPVTAYILSVFAFWGLQISNFDFLIRNIGLSDKIMVQTLRSLNFDKHYQDLLSGQISPDNIIYFGIIIAFALWLNVVSIDYKKN